MRKEYKKALRELISEGLKHWQGSLLPKPTGLTIATIVKKISDECWQIIRFRTHPYGEAFGVEIGWNSSPSLADPNFANPDFFDYNDKALNLSSFSIGLRLLAEGGEICWDIHDDDQLIEDPLLLTKEISHEEAISIVTPAFREAMSLLNNVGFVFLDRHKARLTGGQSCA